MCNTCWYERLTKQEQYACFRCRCTKNISRRRPRPKQFYFAADGVPHFYETQRRHSFTETGIPKCSECAECMSFVGPHFRGPPKRKIKQWKQLKNNYNCERVLCRQRLILN